MRPLYVKVDKLIDLLEIIQDTNDSEDIKNTITEVIDIVYEIAE